MAGFYPDYPSWRMAWDRDGTTMYQMDGNSMTPVEVSHADILKLNNELGDSVNFENKWVVIIFPELRDLDGLFISHTENSRSFNLHVSADTTNGVDGTWTLVNAEQISYNGTVKPNYRLQILSETVLAIKALKFQVGPNDFYSDGYVESIHLYGEPAPGENPHRLEIWHPTLDERVPPGYFDWGDVPRGSTEDRPFRVKNMSPTMTANSIRVYLDVLTDTAPSVPGQHLISQGGSFLAQQNIGSLAPESVSAPLTMRRITASNATLSLWDFRLLAESQNWT